MVRSGRGVTAKRADHSRSSPQTVQTTVLLFHFTTTAAAVPRGKYVPCTCFLPLSHSCDTSYMEARTASIHLQKYNLSVNVVYEIAIEATLRRLGVLGTALSVRFALEVMPPWPLSLTYLVWRFNSLSLSLTPARWLTPLSSPTSLDVPFVILFTSVFPFLS